MNLQKIALTLALSACLLAALPSAGVAQANSYVELLRADLRADKVAILTAAMELSEADSETFWSVYRVYENELRQLEDRRLAMIKSYAASYPDTTDEQAESIIDEWVDLQEDRIKLKKKIGKQISKELSATVAVRFLQVENTLGLLIDLQLASEIPLVEPAP